MTNLIIVLIVLTLLAYIISYIVNAEVYVSPIVGSMVGALHSKTDFEEGITGHTIQVCIFIIAITVVWEAPTG